MHVPHLLVEPLLPAVKAVRWIIGGEPVRVAVQGEAACSDEVSVASNDRAEIESTFGALGLVLAQRREAEHDGCAPALPVRRGDVGDNAAIAHERHADAAAGSHGVPGDGLAICCRAERRAGQRRALGRRQD